MFPPRDNDDPPLPNELVCTCGHGRVAHTVYADPHSALNKGCALCDCAAFQESQPQAAAAANAEAMLHGHVRGMVERFSAGVVVALVAQQQGAGVAFMSSAGVVPNVSPQVLQRTAIALRELAAQFERQADQAAAPEKLDS
jgi:hypothetical protein